MSPSAFETRLEPRSVVAFRRARHKRNVVFAQWRNLLFAVLVYLADTEGQEIAESEVLWVFINLERRNDDADM